jgi:hypothetical protein
VCQTSERSYRANERAAGEARRFAEAAVVAWLDPPGWPKADDVGLVTSELVSAAVSGGAAEVTVELAVHADALEISVSDDRPPGTAVPPGAVGTLSITQRIVAALVAERRDDVAGGRPRVWVRLALLPHHTSGVVCDRVA